MSIPRITYSNRKDWGYIISRRGGRIEDKISLFNDASNWYKNKNLNITASHFSYALCSIIDQLLLDNPRKNENKVINIFHQAMRDFDGAELMLDPKIKIIKIRIDLICGDFFSAKETLSCILSDVRVCLMDKKIACNIMLDSYKENNNLHLISDEVFYQDAKLFYKFLCDKNLADSFTFGIAIKLFGIKDFQLALKSFINLKTNEKNITHDDEFGSGDTRPLSIGCRAILDACVANEKCFEAFEIFEELERENKINTYILTSMIKVTNLARYEARPEYTPEYFYQKVLNWPNVCQKAVYHAKSLFFQRKQNFSSGIQVENVAGFFAASKSDLIFVRKLTSKNNVNFFINNKKKINLSSNPFGYFENIGCKKFSEIVSLSENKDDKRDSPVNRL